MKSDGPWELDIIGERVLELIVQLGLGPVILCGYSSGGVIALSAALRDEEGRINGLMISNTGANTKGHSDPNLPNQIRDHWPEEGCHPQIYFPLLCQRMSGGTVSATFGLCLWHKKGGGLGLYPLQQDT